MTSSYERKTIVWDMKWNKNKKYVLSDLFMIQSAQINKSNVFDPSIIRI